MTAEESVPTETNRASRTTDDGAAGPLLARFARPRTDTPTTLAVIADPHVSVDGQGTWKVHHRSEALLRTALGDAADRGVDAVVFAGDLTRDGARGDFEAVEALVADCPVPCLAVPGNHDVPKTFDDHDVPAVGEFGASLTPGGLPFHERVGGMDLVGLNSASSPDGSLAGTHDGAISGGEVAWLDVTLADADTPVAVSHHNLPGLLETEAFAWRSSFPVDNAGNLVEVLASHDVPLHVSGHLHVPAVAESNGVRELVCPSLCSFPQAYLVVAVDESGATVRLAPAADGASVAESYLLALDDTSRSRAVAELVADQLGALPLVDEREAERREAPTR
jgi:3',5'-cyclic AMP phosphodiesterase CpdA